MDMNRTFSSNIGINKAVRGLKSMKVIPMSEGSSRCIILDKNDAYIGGFYLENDGTIANYEYLKGLKPIKSLRDILFSVKEFILKEAKKKNLEYVMYSTPDRGRNSKQIKGLCEKLGMKDVGTIGDNRRFVYVINPQKEAEIIEKMNAEALAQRPQKISLYA